MQTISSIFSSILKSIRVCAFCGAYIELLSDKSDTSNFLTLASRVRSPQFCESCWSRVLVKKIAHLVVGYPYLTCSLFNWDARDEELLRALVVSLKGGGPREFFQFYATLLAEQRVRFAPFSPLPKKIIFVPAPSATHKRDHSELLAQSVADITGGEFWPILERVSAQKQKLKSARERRRPKEKRLRVKPGWEEKLGELKVTAKAVGFPLKVIFIDDIITSGATSVSAFQALEAPQDFEVWTLAHRPKFKEL